MSRPCPASAAVGADLLATAAVAVSALRRHLADPDPKVALRAVAELTKLLAVCARHGLAVGTADEAEDLTPRPPLRPGEGAFRPDTLPESSPPSPVATAADLGPEESHVGTLNTPSPGRRGGRGVRSSSVSLPVTSPAQQPALPPGGRPLTSFLGSPAARDDAG